MKIQEKVNVIQTGNYMKNILMYVYALYILPYAKTLECSLLSLFNS